MTGTDWSIIGVVVGIIGICIALFVPEVRRFLGIGRVKAIIENIWIEFNVLDKSSRRGMRIHIKFRVDRMLNKTGRCDIYFWHSDGAVLKGGNNRLYITPDGNVAVAEGFTPNHEECVFNDFVIFMPHEEFHLPHGSHNLQFMVRLFDHNNEQIAISNYIHFNLNLLN